MDIRNRRSIRASANRALAAARNPSKIALIYTLAGCLLGLVSTFVSFLLNDRIALTGGLSSMGIRSVLTTIQSVLPIVQIVVTACLNLGYHFAVLRIARGNRADPGTLLEGFRNFGPLLRLIIIQVMLYFAISMGTMYLSTFVFMATPWSDPFYQLVEPMLSTTSVLQNQLILDEATMLAATELLLPMMWIFVLLLCLFILPISYSLRMAVFSLADDPRAGAFAALRKSIRLMRRKRFQLFRLDLTFWWFYALQLVINLICYGDLLLPTLGIQLPWSNSISYYVFYVLSMAVQIISYYFVLNRVHVSYAVAYEVLRQPGKPQPRAPQNFPFSTDYTES